VLALLQGSHAGSWDGWYSTNILGNLDGEVLELSRPFKPKKITTGAPEYIRPPRAVSDVVRKVLSQGSHQLLPPRGDNRGWTIVDFLSGSLPDADQGDFFVPRLDSCGAHRLGPRFCFLDLAPRAACVESKSGSALFQSPMTAPGPIPSMICSFNDKLKYPALD